MRILAAGGGSGGHVTPVAAVLSELADLSGSTDLQVRFVCDTAFEAQARNIMQSVSLPVEVSIISAGKLRRYRHFRWYNYLEHPSIIIKNLVDGIKITLGFMQSLVLLYRFRPDVVFAKGGYVCLPVGYAAKLLGIPVVIHDSDARPGLTNRLLAPFAHAIATGYPLENYTYDAKKSQYVGVPVRAGYRPYTEEQQIEARESLQLPVDRPIIVSFGGGLGSATINAAMLDAANTMNDAYFVIIAGKKHFEAATKQAEHYSENVRVYEFVTTELVDLLAAAHIVVSRASATSLQELAALHQTIIAVPARQLGDQAHNAAIYRAADAAVVLEDDELEAGALQPALAELLNDAVRREELARRLHEFARPNAARAVAEMIQRVYREHRR